jgi:hypothetical protein
MAISASSALPSAAQNINKAFSHAKRETCTSRNTVESTSVNMRDANSRRRGFLPRRH